MDTLLQAPYRKDPPFRLSSTLWGVDRTFNMNAPEVEAVRAGLGDGLHEFPILTRIAQENVFGRCRISHLPLVGSLSGLKSRVPARFVPSNRDRRLQRPVRTSNT